MSEYSWRQAWQWTACILLFWRKIDWSLAKFLWNFVSKYILQKTWYFFRGFDTDIFILDVRDFVVDKGVNKLRSGRTGFRIPTRKRLFFTFFKICRLVVCSKQRPILWVPDNFSGVNQPEREIGHSSLVPDLRVSGRILVFFLYVFIVWTETALPIHSHDEVRININVGSFY